MNREAQPRADIALTRAEMLIDLQRWSEACELLGSLVAADPDDAPAWNLLARAQLGAGRPERALAAAENAASLEPTHPAPQHMISIVLGQMGRSDEAVTAAREAVRLAPYEWVRHAQLAYALIDTRRGRREAVEAASRAVDMAPEQPHAHLALAAALGAVGRHRAGRAAAERALALDPTCSTAHDQHARGSVGRQLIARPATLARAAGGFSTAVGLDPRAGHSKHGLDAVLRQFLHLVAWFSLVAAMIVYQVSEHAGHVPRALPLLLPAVPLVFAVRFVRALPPAPRRVLLREARSRPLVAPVLLVTASLSFLSMSAFAPQDDRGLMVSLAGCTALWSRFHFLFELRRSARAAGELPAQHSFSSVSLLLIAVTLMFTGLVVALGAEQHRIPAQIAGLACIALGVRLVRTVVRRRRSA